MLVLTRRIGEEILIEGGIRVIVLNVQGRRVRLGVDAPADLGIHRREIMEPQADPLQSSPAKKKPLDPVTSQKRL